MLKVCICLREEGYVSADSKLMWGSCIITSHSFLFLPDTSLVFSIQKLSNSMNTERKHRCQKSESQWMLLDVNFSAAGSWLTVISFSCSSSCVFSSIRAFSAGLCSGFSASSSGPWPFFCWVAVHNNRGDALEERNDIIQSCCVNIESLIQAVSTEMLTNNYLFSTLCFLSHMVILCTLSKMCISLYFSAKTLSDVSIRAIKCLHNTTFTAIFGLSGANFMVHKQKGNIVETGNVQDRREESGIKRLKFTWMLFTLAPCLSEAKLWIQRQLRSFWSGVLLRPRVGAKHWRNSVYNVRRYLE